MDPRTLMLVDASSCMGPEDALAFRFEVAEEVNLLDTPTGPLVRKYVSDVSGMTAIFQKTDSQVLDVRVVAKTLPESDNGAPHALEHILYRSKLTKRLVQKNLASLPNAFTSPSKTAYLLRAATDKNLVAILPQVLKDIKRPENINPVTVASEVHYVDGKGEHRGTVFGELQMTANTPQRRQFDDFRTIVTKGTPYEYISGGSLKALPTLTAEAVKDYHRRYYQWSNMAVIVSGDADEDVILKCLEGIEASLGPDPKLTEEEVLDLEQKRSAKPKTLTETLYIDTKISGPPGSPGQLNYWFRMKEDDDPSMMYAVDALTQILYAGVGSLVGGPIIQEGLATTCNSTSLILGMTYHGASLIGVEDYDGLAARLSECGRASMDKMDLDMIHKELKRQKMRVLKDIETDSPDNLEGILEAYAQDQSLKVLSVRAINELFEKDLDFWKELAASCFLDNKENIVCRAKPGNYGTLVDVPEVDEREDMADLAAAVALDSKQVPSDEEVDALPSSDAIHVLPTLTTLKNYDAPDVNGRQPTYYSAPQTPGEVAAQAEIDRFGVPVVVHNEGGSFVRITLFSRLPKPGDPEVADMSQEDLELMLLSQSLVCRLAAHCDREYQGEAVSSEQFLRSINGQTVYNMWGGGIYTRNPTLGVLRGECYYEDLEGTCDALASTRTLKVTNESVKKIVDGMLNHLEFYVPTHGVGSDAEVLATGSDDVKAYTTANLLHVLKKNRDNIDGIRMAFERTIEQHMDPSRTTIEISGDVDKLDAHAFERIRKIGNFTRTDESSKPSLLAALRPNTDDLDPLEDQRLNLTTLTTGNPDIKGYVRIPSARSNVGHSAVLQNCVGLKDKLSETRRTGDCYCAFLVRAPTDAMALRSVGVTNSSGVCTIVPQVLDRAVEEGLDKDVEIATKTVKLTEMANVRNKHDLASEATNVIIHQRHNSTGVCLEQLKDVTPESLNEFARQVLPPLARSYRGDGGYLVAISKDNDSMNRSLEESGIPIARHLDQTETAKYLRGEAKYLRGEAAAPDWNQESASPPEDGKYVFRHH